MPQIGGKGNTYHTFKMVFQKEIKDESIKKSKEKLHALEMEVLITLLEKHKIKNINHVGKGFVAYQFEFRESPSPHVSFQDSFLENILMLTHFEKKAIQRKNLSETVQDLVSSPKLNPIEKKMLKKVLDTLYFNIYYQDFMFIPNDSITLIFPSNNAEDTLKYQLKPYIEGFFEIDLDPIVRKITQDTLEWLVWKIKLKKGGNLGDIKIDEIEMYGTGAHGNTGDLTIKIDGIEENVYAKASMVDESRCKSIELTLAYNAKPYRFSLEPEGKYSVIWSGTAAYTTDKPKINKILTLRDISLIIIPYIYQKYQEDKPAWDVEKLKFIEEIQGNLQEYYKA